MERCVIQEPVLELFGAALVVFDLGLVALGQVISWQLMGVNGAKTLGFAFGLIFYVGQAQALVEVLGEFIEPGWVERRGRLKV